MIHQVEILENILSRLPAKSIGRFRCVSKPWRSLLTQPHFIKAHLNRTKQSSITEKSILLESKEPGLPEYETNENRLARSLYSIQLRSTSALDETTTAALLPSRLSIAGDHRFVNGFNSSEEDVASCDGLVLLEDEDKRLLLLNPTTRETKELPASPYALKPDDSHIMYGLGYDSFSDDYKVVSIAFYGHYYDYFHGQYLSEHEPYDNVTKVCVYSVKNGTWKRVDNSPYDHIHCALRSGVFVNGHIHWIACESSNDFLKQWVIAAFDLKEEKFRQVPPPCSSDGYYWANGDGQLAMVEDCLCLLPGSKPIRYRDEDDYDESLDNFLRTIFVMKEYNVEDPWTETTTIDHQEYDVQNSWTEFSTIDLEIYDSTFNHEENLKIRPLCSLGKEQMVLLTMTAHYHPVSRQKKLVIYNQEGRSKDIFVQGIQDEFSVIGTFIESLVSPHCICNNEAVNQE